jgi:hypothetical protein
LTTEDQVQLSEGGRTYFFEAYRSTTTAANTSSRVDLRSTFFDPLVLLYQRNTDGTLRLLAADDQTGGLGQRRSRKRQCAVADDPAHGWRLLHFRHQRERRAGRAGQLFAQACAPT